MQGIGQMPGIAHCLLSTTISEIFSLGFAVDASSELHLRDGGDLKQIRAAGVIYTFPTMHGAQLVVTFCM